MSNTDTKVPISSEHTYVIRKDGAGKWEVISIDELGFYSNPNLWSENMCLNGLRKMYPYYDVQCDECKKRQ